MRAHIFAILPIFSLFVLGGCKSSESQHVDNDDITSSEVAADADIITLDSHKLSLSQLDFDTVKVDDAGFLRATGHIGYNENKLSHIGSRTEGRVIDLTVDIGSKVSAGQTLGTLESPLIGQIRAEEKEAIALHRITMENYEREKELMNQGISTRKEFLASELEFRKAEAALRGAKERLIALGADGGSGGRFTISAPFNGVIVQKHVSLGEMVTPADQLFTIADLSRLWVQIEVFERDISRLFIGQSVVVKTAAYPDREFAGKVFNVGALVDSTKKTITARVELLNDDRALKPGMFANASIRIPVSSSGNAGLSFPHDIIVPLNAIQRVNSKSVIFVPGRENGQFRIVPLRVLESRGDSAVVVEGEIKVGDRIVVGGSHLLKAELSKEDLESHSH